VYDLTAGNGDIDWEFLEPRRRKGQRVIAEHHQVGQFPHLNAAEGLFLEARVGGVDGLAPQGLLHVKASPAFTFWPLSVWCATAVPRSRNGSTG
jgi:hypothetical protein